MRRSPLQGVMSFGEPDEAAEATDTASEVTQPAQPLRWLVIVRHGDYDDDTMSLTENGRGQIAALARMLQPCHSSAAKTVILSSDRKRALESAQILKLELGQDDAELMASELVTSKVLAEMNREPKNMPAVYELLQQAEDAELVIMTAHVGQANCFPPYFFREHLHCEPPLEDEEELKKGEAWLIGVREKTMVRLSPGK